MMPKVEGSGTLAAPLAWKLTGSQPLPFATGRIPIPAIASCKLWRVSSFQLEISSGVPVPLIVIVPAMGVLYLRITESIGSFETETPKSCTVNSRFWTPTDVSKAIVPESPCVEPAGTSGGSRSRRHSTVLFPKTGVENRVPGVFAGKRNRFVSGSEINSRYNAGMK